jgi:hypothetical protein
MRLLQPARGRGTSWLDVNLVTWPGRCAIVRFVAETMIAVDGGEVWADDSGGGGAPVVLLHPGVGDSRIWEPVLPALTASWRVIRYDARGFGRSPAPAVKFSLLADLITVLDYFGLAIRGPRNPMMGWTPSTSVRWRPGTSRPWPV